MTRRIALCLPGGGANGALFQIGAVSALEDTIEGFDGSSFDLYVASSGGASTSVGLSSLKAFNACCGLTSSRSKP